VRQSELRVPRRHSITEQDQVNRIESQGSHPTQGTIFPWLVSNGVAFHFARPWRFCAPDHSVVETYMNVASITYSATNSADLNRDVLIEHPRGSSEWTLDGDLKPAETSPNLYRFNLPVAAHVTAKLEVRERGPVVTSVALVSSYNQSVYLLDLIKRVPDALEKLKPVIDTQAELTGIELRINESRRNEQTASADEARDRENLIALKGNDAAKRFVDELNRAEDQLQSTRKQTADLELRKKVALDKLNALISSITFDWSVTEK
jgi:hypothetical protein